MREDGDYYVYTLSYPNEMGGGIFYVGKGNGRRMFQHEGDAKGIWRTEGLPARFRDNSLKCQAIRKIWDNGFEVVRNKPYEHLMCGEACTLEMRLIRSLSGTGLLTNKQGVASYLQLKNIEGGHKFSVSIAKERAQAFADIPNGIVAEACRELLEDAAVFERWVLLATSKYQSNKKEGVSDTNV